MSKLSKYEVNLYKYRMMSSTL